MKTKHSEFREYYITAASIIGGIIIGAVWFMLDGTDIWKVIKYLAMTIPDAVVAVYVWWCINTLRQPDETDIPRRRNHGHKEKDSFT